MKRVSQMLLRFRLNGLIIVSILLYGATTVEAKKIRVAIPVPGKSEIVFVGANEKGYYKDEDLEVELVVTGGRTGTLALIAGDVDFFTSVSDTFIAGLRGAPLRILFTSFYRTTLWLYSRPEIREIKDLKNKRAAVSSIGSAADVYLREVLSRHGLEGGRDVFILAMGQPAGHYAALLGGSAEAAMLADPYNLTAKEAGYRELISFLTDETDIVHLTGGIAAREDLLRSDRVLAEKFIRATLKGLKYVRENRTETIQILARTLKVKEDLAAKTYDLFRPTMTTDGTVDRELQKRSLELRMKFAGLKDAPPLEKFFDFSLARKVHAELDAKRWSPKP
jgi:NitT/TauT family transport system substrate-binding protein